MRGQNVKAQRSGCCDEVWRKRCGAVVVVEVIWKGQLEHANFWKSTLAEVALLCKPR